VARKGSAKGRREGEKGGEKKGRERDGKTFFSNFLSRFDVLVYENFPVGIDLNMPKCRNLLMLSVMTHSSPILALCVFHVLILSAILLRADCT